MRLLHSVSAGPTAAQPGPSEGPHLGLGAGGKGSPSSAWSWKGVEAGTHSGVGRGLSGAFPACCASLDSAQMPSGCQEAH